MVDGIKTKTLTISNGDFEDATPVDTMFSDLYGNDALLNNAIAVLQTMFSNGNLSATFINEAVSGRGVAVDNVLLQDGMIRLLAIRTTISSTTNGSAVITTGTHSLSTGDPVKYMTAPGVSVDGGLSTILTYYARVIDSTHIQFHPTLVDAQNNTNPVTVTSAVTGLRYIIAAPVSTPSDGRVWMDTTGMHYTLGGVVKNLPADTYDLLANFNGTKAPKYLSNTTLSVAQIVTRDSGGNSSIIKSGTTTVDISTTGLNGIAQSANLTGNVTVTSGSNAVSFSTSQAAQLQANDVIVTAGGQARKLISVSGTSAVAESQFSTTETNVTFKRGGRASFYTANTSGTVGTAHYWLYAISDGVTPGLILSTRNVAKGDTLVDLPAGYILSRLLPFAVTLYNISTASGVYIGNITPFQIATGWPYRSEIRLTTQMSGNYGGTYIDGLTQVLKSGNATAYTPIDLSLWVPPNSRLCTLSYASNAVYTALRPTGGNDTVAIGVNAPFSHGILPNMPTSSAQSIDYKNNGAGGNMNIDVYSYVITETF